LSVVFIIFGHTFDELFDCSHERLWKNSRTSWLRSCSGLTFSVLSLRLIFCVLSLSFIDMFVIRGRDQSCRCIGWNSFRLFWLLLSLLSFWMINMLIVWRSDQSCSDGILFAVFLEPFRGFSFFDDILETFNSID
jgi:hypothetical protein